ncbi:FAD synthetase family protein [Amycolatopsis mongoliensis]|uniref:FAD synthase n=1 Tax=Amycolatopsis mongoliensis TaxID=715475 RepID=A0A9Y2JM11_9PSEU|nr:FAD synthetase family protein [Amycolatopsis sp. 4-36]WIY00995.1 FAD synthetase family protein [Amycolatopsis sp. 4-36]
MELSERSTKTVQDQAFTVSSIDDADHRTRSIAIGCFDGVHLGHRDVISGCDTVLTFAPHPLRVLRPSQAPPLLTGHARKLAKLSALGVREVVIIPFDTSWASQTAETFVDEILVGTLNASHVSVGFNFRFGARGAGTAGRLREDRRFGTRVVPAVTAGPVVVSSTVIRSLVERGKLTQAAKLLGAPLVQPATIRKDRTLHFAPDLAVPADGVHVCQVDGVLTQVSFTGRPRILDAAEAWETKTGEVIVTFPG